MPDNPIDKSELQKLGSGQSVDLDKLYEQMDEDHMDKLLKRTEQTPPPQKPLPPGPFSKP